MAKLGDFEALRLVLKLSLHALQLTDTVFEVACHPGAMPPKAQLQLGARPSNYRSRCSSTSRRHDVSFHRRVGR
jgi:hypothetical protein